jgi:hypothetical protein
MTQTEGACVVCGVALPPPARTGPPRLTCSSRCRNEKYARAHGVQPRRGKWAPHGGSGRRYEDGCCCDECRQAMRERKMRSKLAARAKGVPANAVHGLSTYDWYGCRCDICKAAKSAENASRSRTRRAAS